MPTHESLATIRNSERKEGLAGKDAARAEVITASDDDYQPQYALGDPFTSTWNLYNTGANEVQTVQITDGLGGTFTISFDGQTTAAIAHDATAAVVEDALNALSNVYPGDITVTKAGTTADHTYTFTFGGQLGKANQAEVTCSVASVTGPSVTVATTTPGTASPAVNEIQTVTVAGATGGDFTLTYSGQTTSALAFNVSAADMKTALEALSNIEPADMTVTKDGSVYTVTFGGTLAATDVAQMTATATGLTPDPAAVVATTVAGAAA